MKYTYACKKVPLNDSIKDYAEKRVEKLEKYFHREDASAFVMNGTDMLDQPFGVADDDAHARSKASLFCHFDEFLRVLETAAPDGTARLQQGKLKPSSTSKVSWPGSSAIACVPGGRQFPISYQVRRKRERNRELSSEAVLGFEGSSSKALSNFAPRELLSITQAKFLCKRLFRVLLKSFLRFRIRFVWLPWRIVPIFYENSSRKPLSEAGALTSTSMCDGGLTGRMLDTADEHRQ